jgi:uncharacterized repeat protein (TIGR01451 family)
MKVLPHRLSLLASCLVVLLLVGSGAAAFVGRPDVKVSLLGTVEREQQLIQLDKAGLLNPGEVLHWTITSHNTGSAPAHQYKAVGEIPTGTAYVAGSARAAGTVNITYSIDAGKSFEAKPMMVQKQPDGSHRKIPAPTSLYTHVRYEWNDPLAEGKQFAAMYKVRVK